MTQITAEEIDQLRLPVARRGGQGYSAVEVDDFLDAVARALREGADVAALARSASFTIATRPGEGYSAQEVDELIDRLTGDVTPGGVGAGQASTTELRSSLGENSPAWSTSTQMLPEEPGFFARLFGRR